MRRKPRLPITMVVACTATAVVVMVSATGPSASFRTSTGTHRASAQLAAPPEQVGAYLAENSNRNGPIRKTRIGHDLGRRPRRGGRLRQLLQFARKITFGMVEIRQPQQFRGLLVAEQDMQEPDFGLMLLGQVESDLQPCRPPASHRSPRGSVSNSISQSQVHAAARWRRQAPAAVCSSARRVSSRVLNSVGRRHRPGRSPVASGSQVTGLPPRPCHAATSATRAETAWPIRRRVL